MMEGGVRDSTRSEIYINLRITEELLKQKKLLHKSSHPNTKFSPYISKPNSRNAFHHPPIHLSRVSSHCRWPSNRGCHFRNNKHNHLTQSDRQGCAFPPPPSIPLPPILTSQLQLSILSCPVAWHPLNLLPHSNP